MARTPTSLSPILASARSLDVTSRRRSESYLHAVARRDGFIIPRPALRTVFALSNQRGWIMVGLTVDYHALLCLLPLLHRSGNRWEEAFIHVVGVDAWG